MSTKGRQCKNNPDVFCYICGKYMVKYRFNERDFTKRAYEAYFGVKLGDKNKHCTETLRFWTQGKVNSKRFGVPMVRPESKNHPDDYFCMVDVWIESAKDWFYPDIESARRPIPHCAEVPVFTSSPDLTAHKMLLEAIDYTDSSDSSISNSSSMAAAASSLSAKPKPFNHLRQMLRFRNKKVECVASFVVATLLDCFQPNCFVWLNWFCCYQT